MGAKTSNFTRKKEKAIAALLTTDTVEQAANVAGIAESTLYRWLKEPVFLEQYRKARKAAVDQAISTLQERANKAAKALIDIAEDQEMPPSTRVAAAREILQTSIKGVERDDFERRLEALERMIMKGGKQ
jgi:transposase